MLTQQKGVDFTGKDLKGRELGVGICQRKDGKICQQTYRKIRSEIFPEVTRMP